jgi:hypothetical protein
MSRQGNSQIWVVVCIYVEGVIDYRIVEVVGIVIVCGNAIVSGSGSSMVAYYLLFYVVVVVYWKRGRL